jgi:hypothetical protein
MARKEISTFSVSFLDLLSGALAAVIILFIIVPKMSSEQAEAAETLENLSVDVSELDSLLKVAQNSMPATLYDQMQQSIAQLEAEISNLESQVADCERNRTELAETRQQLESARQRIAELERSQPASGNGPGAVIFGLNAELGITCSWPENVDVDLHIKNTATGEWCFFDRGHRNTPFGTLMEDITFRAEGDNRYELIYQDKIVPGSYDIYVHLYSESGNATINGYIVIFPYTRNEQKISFGPIQLRNSGTRPALPRSGVMVLT